MGSCLSTTSGDSHEARPPRDPSTGIGTLLCGVDDPESKWRGAVSIEPISITATFVNETQNETLILCWVNGQGRLCHYIPIHAAGSIRDGSVDNTNKHFTQSGHCFVVYSRIEITPQYLSDVPASAFRALYRGFAEVPNETHVIRIKDSGKVDIEIISLQNEKTLIDNTHKVFYKSIESGFECYYDDGVKDSAKDIIRQDLKEVNRLLPAKALDLLQKDTPFYFNSSLLYGYEESPLEGAHATYHPRGSLRWLQEHGLSENHEGSIEIMNTEHYIRDRVCWGPGGLLLHELSHCMHDKHLPGGYNNESLRAMYNEAMNKGLYDKVRSRRPDGTYAELQKGYCCTDPMEFFAETSVAYLFEGASEFNKWYPHSRSQLKTHDEDTFKVLEKVWV